MLTKDRFDFFCRAVGDFGVEHVILRQGGEELFRHDWIPEERQNQYSVSKSFTGIAVGFACEEGLISLDDRVIDYFPEERPKNLTPEWEAMKIRHLCTMQMGFTRPYLMGFQRQKMTETDWVRFLFERPLPDMPGRYFVYSNAGPYLAGILIQRLTGGSLTDYLMPRLFEPLGIGRPEWEKDRQGNTFGAGGLQLTTSEVARFGQMILDGGKVQGKQVVPLPWMKKVYDTTVTAGDSQEYGMLFWRGRYGSISATGRYGQYCTIVPEKQLVIAINSMDAGDDNLLEYVWTYLYPHL